jgi:single-strand DNA-binding protein
MYETTVTVQGWLGNDVTTRAAGDVQVASFRVATTPRRFHRQTETWVDGATQWYSVTAWRALGDNCRQSLRRGDPVVVHGRLTVKTWTGRDGDEQSTLEIEAVHVGHDLTRGTSQFTRTPKQVAATPPTEPGHADGAGAVGTEAA